MNLKPTFGKSVGDRVRFLVPNGLGRDGVDYKVASGRVVMKFPTHLVVNMGGRNGKPGVVTPENFVS
jgi:hypothetical protein